MSTSGGTSGGGCENAVRGCGVKIKEWRSRSGRPSATTKHALDNECSAIVLHHWRKGLGGTAPASNKTDVIFVVGCETAVRGCVVRLVQRTRGAGAVCMEWREHARRAPPATECLGVCGRSTIGREERGHSVGRPCRRKTTKLPFVGLGVVRGHGGAAPDSRKSACTGESGGARTRGAS